MSQAVKYSWIGANKNFGWVLRKTFPVKEPGDAVSTRFDQFIQSQWQECLRDSEKMEISENRGITFSPFDPRIRIENLGVFRININSFRSLRPVLPDSEQPKSVFLPQHFFYGFGKKFNPNRNLAFLIIDGQKISIIANQFPWTPFNLLINSVENRPQFITIHDLISSQKILLRSSAIRILINSWGAGATVNHLHQHAFYKSLPIEDVTTREIGKIKGVSIKEPFDWPASCIILSGKGKEFLFAKFLLISILQTENTPHNILQNREQSFSCPRSIEIPPEIPIRFAGAEVNGEFVVDETLAQKITAEKIKLCLKEVSVSYEEMEAIRKEFMERFESCNIEEEITRALKIAKAIKSYYILQDPKNYFSRFPSLGETWRIGNANEFRRENQRLFSRVEKLIEQGKPPTIFNV
jgi:hypothetical protein